MELEIAEAELIATKDNLNMYCQELEMEIADAELIASKDNIKTYCQELEMERDVTFMKESPFIHSCGANDGWLYTTSNRVKFTKQTLLRPQSESWEFGMVS